MKGGEIDVRERVAQILGKAGDAQGLDLDEAQSKLITGRLKDAIAHFFPGDFVVSAPLIEFASGDDPAAFSNVVVVVLQLHGSDNRVHVALDVESVDVLIGHCFGKSGAEGEPAHARSLTRFDRTVVADFAYKIVRDIWGNNAVEKIVFEEPDIGALLPPAPSCLMRWSISAGADTMDLAMHAAASLVAPPPREDERSEAATAVKATWHAHMEHALSQTILRLDAMIEGPEMTLGDVAALRVGQVFELGDASGLAVTLRCEGDGLFAGEMGRKDGRFAVTVARALGNLSDHLGAKKTSSRETADMKVVD